MEKIWSDAAWDDYLYWQTQDKKTLKKINELIKCDLRTPAVGDAAASGRGAVVERSAGVYIPAAFDV